MGNRRSIGRRAPRRLLQAVCAGGLAALFAGPARAQDKSTFSTGCVDGKAFEDGTVLMLGEFSAVALWMPPGAKPDGNNITDVLIKSVKPAKHEDTFSVLEQMDAAHPKYEHWYLPWFGVDAALQGKGLGSQLMKLCLDIVDASRLPAYLETPNPRTISFYERHGFGTTGAAQAGACPPITFMLRGAR